MREELEAAARALWELQNPNDPPHVWLRTNPVKWYDGARVILLALREPTPAMVKASNRTGNSHGADKWRAIVDYILGDTV